MSTIDPITRASAATGGTAPAAQTGTLGKDDFLKLLVGQMRNQNPMSPSGDQEWIAQMTQFSVLEQLTNVASGTQTITEEQRMSQALGLIGRTVTYLDAEGAAQTGTVERVTLTAEGPRLTVGGRDGVAPSAISEVR